MIKYNIKKNLILLLLISCAWNCKTAPVFHGSIVENNKHLFEKGITQKKNINLIRNQKSSLDLAIKHKRYEFAVKLVKAGAVGREEHLDMIDMDVEVPHNFELFEILLSKGLKAKQEHISLAIKHKRYEFAVKLVKAGAIGQEEHLDMIDMDVDVPHNFELFEILLSKELKAKQEHINLAIKHNNHELIKLFINYGVLPTEEHIIFFLDDVTQNFEILKFIKNAELDANLYEKRLEELYIVGKDDEVALLQSIGVPGPSAYAIYRKSLNPGDHKIYSINNSSFKMIFVPEIDKFPIGLEDFDESRIDNPYWIAETEVTYKFWQEIYEWAILNGYHFQNDGTEMCYSFEIERGLENLKRGFDKIQKMLEQPNKKLKTNNSEPEQTGIPEEYKHHPVNKINWRDAIVWCNALTEWFNVNKNTEYSFVYIHNGKPIRDSRNSNANICDGVKPVENASGFRLPTGDEWELAARWRNDSINTVYGYSNPWFTTGYSASGAPAPIDRYQDSESAQYKEAEDYAHFNKDFSKDTTVSVKSKKPNSLGIYGMSGNISEWCFDWLYSEINEDHGRLLMGGGYCLPEVVILIGARSWNEKPEKTYDFIGFRIVKNIHFNIKEKPE